MRGTDHLTGIVSADHAALKPPLRQPGVGWHGTASVRAGTGHTVLAATSLDWKESALAKRMHEQRLRLDRMRVRGWFTIRIFSAERLHSDPF
jgi:hypothetical protein